MTPPAISWSCALALVLAPARVQQDDAIEKIEVRVTTTTPGSVIVDRGSTDGLMRGDRVVLTPKEGATYEGFVDEPLERIARVELADSTANVAAGTRGDVLIPKARLNRKKGTEKGTEPPKPATDEKTKPVKKKRSTTTKAPNVPGTDAVPAAPATGDGTKKPVSTVKKPATSPPADGSKTTGDGARTASDGTKPTSDGAKGASDGSKSVANGTKPTSDGAKAPADPPKPAGTAAPVAKSPGTSGSTATPASPKTDPSKAGAQSATKPKAGPPPSKGGDASVAKSTATKPTTTGAKPAATGASGATGATGAAGAAGSSGTTNPTRTSSKNVKAPAKSADGQPTASDGSAVATDGTLLAPSVAATKPPSTQSTPSTQTAQGAKGTQSTTGGTKSGAKPAASGAAKSGQASTKPATPPDHTPWKAQDEGFTKDKPLLSLLKPLRPEQRATRLTGNVWAGANVSDFDEGKGSDSYARAGVVLDLENPFNEGGAVHLDTEVNYRDEVNGGTGFDLLTRRLSYSRGGTRFDANYWEVGRFLQYGMPEFEWVDGVEFQHRTEGGDRFGASAGYMPEPDDDFRSFRDFQVAAYYLWANDESERFTLGGGVQQTWHDGGVDRDLLVAKARFLPGDGWDFHCANWFDWYGAGDNVKDVDYGLTQAVWSLSRHYPSDSWWDLTYRKVSFPDIDREGEFIYSKSAIDHNRLHKLMLSGSNWWSKQTRLHGRLGGWIDEDESGGTVEAGIEFEGPFFENARLDFTGFGTLGEFTSLVGGRVSYGAFVENGRWDLFYEIANNHEDGFVTDIQDVPQHRLYATRSFYLPSGWTISATAGVLYLDSEFGWNVGFFVQKSF